MILWLRPQYILALITSLFYCSSLVFGKTHEKFICATAEGQHQLSCPDEKALLTELSIRKVYRRTETCQPDEHSEDLIYCQSIIDGSICEGHKNCSIEISSRDYLQCGEKIYLPTYFFIKFSCAEIHTMCDDKAPIRNTLYGYIVSPGYPYPLADNLKCSINIEADPSMFIEISPIEIHLQETLKCRSEYLEIFGYDSTTIDETENNWKSYFTWCTDEQQSSSQAVSRPRYLIRSNSLYISLQTGKSRKSRLFKIRYKIIPSKFRSQYNADGFAAGPKDQGDFSLISNSDSSTPIVLTTLTAFASNSTDQRNSDGSSSKRTFRKEILIGSIVSIVLLVVGLTIGLLVFILVRRRKSSKNSSKKSSSSTNQTNNVTSKGPLGKCQDKTPLLDQKTSNNNDGKRKLIPERTVQIGDVKTSRFKSNENENVSTTKSPLTAADSGIYGADLSEETKSSIKPRIFPSTNDDLSNSVQEKNFQRKNSPTIVEQEDQTIQSAYPALIDATTSENETNVNLVEEKEFSRRSSTEIFVEPKTTNEFEIGPKTSLPFNPLHVILKKDANKYYTTEYI